VAHQVCALKGCWLKDLTDVTEEELEIQFQLLLKLQKGAACG
jgi:hypothetical protein